MTTTFSTFIYRIKYRIKKLCDFIKLGWNDYDYYDSLLRLEYLGMMILRLDLERQRRNKL